MDPVTHAALGVVCALACTGGKKELRRPAAFAGLCAGMLPDVDIFLSSATDPLFTMEYHRHFTHSVVFAPVLALIAIAFTAACWRWIGRKRISMWALFVPALVAALSHGFCDVWTSYGTRSWWPFSDARVTLDWIAVIDPVFTLPLLVGAVLAWVKGSRRVAVVSVVGVAVYLSLCQVQQSRAKAGLLEWARSEGLGEPERITVKPSMGNIIVWRGMVVHEGMLRVVALRCGLGTKVQVMRGDSQKLFGSAEEAVQALGLKEGSVQALAVKRFAHFSDGWIGLHPTEERTIGDLRYAAMPNDIVPLWGIRLNPEGSVEVEGGGEAPPVEMRYFREIKEGDLAKFWGMIRGVGW